MSFMNGSSISSSLREKKILICFCRERLSAWAFYFSQVLFARFYFWFYLIDPTTSLLLMYWYSQWSSAIILINLLFSPLITSHQTTNASADGRSATVQSATWRTSGSESWPPRWPSAASRNRKRSWASAFQRWSPSRSSDRWRLLSERQPLPQWPPPIWPISKCGDLISTLDFLNSKLVFNLPRHQNASQVSGGRSACSDGAFGPGGDDECK